MPTPPLPHLDVVIVTWNHGLALDRCLVSLGRSTRNRYIIDRVTVVDNASDPPFRAGCYAGLPAITVLANNSNRGFAAACNQGARGSHADYLLFLNPDTCVGPRSLEAAVTLIEVDSDRRTGIVGLQLVDDAGVPQATCGRFLTLWNVLNQVSGLSVLAPSRFRGFRMTDWDHGETRTVDYASAACLIVRRPVFEMLNGFDAGLSLYLEDADLSMRARRAGWQTRFAAAEPVAHADGWSTGRHRRWRLANSWRSIVKYGWKHKDPWSAAAITAIVLGIAPLARLAQAGVHRSGREVAAAVGGYAYLWRLLLRDVMTGRPDACDPVATDMPHDLRHDLQRLPGSRQRSSGTERDLVDHTSHS